MLDLVSPGAGNNISKNYIVKICKLDSLYRKNIECKQNLKGLHSFSSYSSMRNGYNDQNIIGKQDFNIFIIFKTKIL